MAEWNTYSLDEHLFQACFDGDHTVVSSLLDRGADPTKQLNAHWPVPLLWRMYHIKYLCTAVHVASFKGHLECLKLLFSSENLTPNVPTILDSNKRTPLHLVCENGCKQITEYLLTQIECNLHIKDIAGKTPLHLASENGHLECVKLIEKSSIDPDVINNDEQTALHLACSSGHKDIVEYLLIHAKSNPNNKDKHGNTPLHLASNNGHFECVESVIEQSSINTDPNLTNNGNQTALHLAFLNFHNHIFEYLITRMNCNPNFNGETILHLACFSGQLDFVQLVIEKSPVDIDPDVTNNYRQTPLHPACSKGHKEVVEYLLIHAKSNPNSRDLNGNTPLHLASMNGHLECVELVIEQSSINTDPGVTNNFKQTALHLAYLSSHKHIFEYLLIHTDCNPDNKNISGETILHLACSRGDLECVQLVIEKSSINIDPDVTNYYKQTALHLACYRGHKDIVHNLVQAKSNPNKKDKYGNTPLHLASKNGHLECVKLVIEKSSINIDPDVTNYDKQTALHLACYRGHKDIVHNLVQAKSNPNKKDKYGNTPLHLASKNGHLECVKLVIEKSSINIDPDVTNYDKQTALHLACYRGHKDIVHNLVQAKSNPNKKDKYGNTPLHLASKNGHLECVKLVIEKSSINIDPDVTNYYKQTALHLAYFNSHKHVFEYLLTHTDCNPNFKDISGETILHLACLRGQFDFVQLVIEKSSIDVDPDVTNNDNQTALHLACSGGRKDVVEYVLIRTKSNPNKKDKHGNTPLHLASLNGHLECVELVIEQSSINTDPGVTNNDKQTALHLAYLNFHKHIFEYLLIHTNFNPDNKNINGETILHLACSRGDLDWVQLVIEKSSINIDPDVTNYDKQTALHLACYRGHKNSVEYLIIHAKCNPNLKDKHGNTALHVASRHNQLECLKLLVATGGINPDERNHDQQTALHIACMWFPRNVPMIEYLLTTAGCDPNLSDKDGYTPLYCSRNQPDKIQLLRHGANPDKVYKKYKQLFGKHAKNPPKLCTKIIVGGDSGAGKTTLVEAFRKERALIRKRVGRVESQTAGIAYHDFESRVYGKVNFMDLAGHRQYINSHSAVIKSSTETSLPIVILVTDVSKSDDEIKQSLAYWLNYFENQLSSITNSQSDSVQLPLIVVGSHIDQLSSKLSIDGKTRLCKKTIDSFSDDIEYIGFIPINCQLSQSPGMVRLRKCLKEHMFQTEDQISFNAHCFHIYLVDNFRDLKAIALRGIQARIVADRKVTIKDEEVSFFLPDSLNHLCKLCQDLNDRGVILFLKDSINLEDSWVVFDKNAILSEVNGKVFAPQELKQHIKLASSTGIVPIIKLEETFSDYNIQMLVGVLKHFELCHGVCDDVVTLINKGDSTDIDPSHYISGSTKEHYLFFPSLVKEESPSSLWEPHTQYCFHFGWVLECTQPLKHFLPRFQTVLCNRLAFNFAAAPDPEKIDLQSLTIYRKCSVWKNGIYWGSRQGVEALVEVDSQCKSVMLLMRGDIMSAQSSYCKLRFDIIQIILKAAQEFCPRIKTAVSLIAHVKDIGHPINPDCKLTLIPLSEVVTTIREDAHAALYKEGRPIPLEDLVGNAGNTYEIIQLGTIQDESLLQGYHDRLDQHINQIAQGVGLKSSQLDKPCSRVQHLPISKKLSNWSVYTDYLQLSPVEVEAIQRDTSLTAPHQQPLEMLKRWYEKNAHSPRVHYRYLLKACLEVGFDTSLAKDICEIVKGLVDEGDVHSKHFSEDQRIKELDQRINQIAVDVDIDPVILDHVCSPKSLLPISQKLTNWSAYPTNLGLSPVVRQSILTNTSLTAPHQRGHKMLEMWQQRCAGTPMAHYRHLVKACLEVDDNAALAGDICRIASRHNSVSPDHSEQGVKPKSTMRTGHLHVSQLESIQTALQDVQHKWRELGSQLQLDQDTIELVAKQNHHKEEHCLKELLTRWLSKEGHGPPTLDCLIKALRSSSVDQPHLVEGLECSLQTSPF